MLVYLMAEILDLEIDQGSSWSIDIQWLNENSQPYDLTGFTARSYFKREYSSSSYEISLTLGSGITLTPLTGNINLSLTNTQTDALSGSYVYDLELVSPAGIVTRLCQGKVTVSPSVTK